MRRPLARTPADRGHHHGRRERRIHDARGRERQSRHRGRDGEHRIRANHGRGTPREPEGVHGGQRVVAVHREVLAEHGDEPAVATQPFQRPGDEFVRPDADQPGRGERRARAVAGQEHRGESERPEFAHRAGGRRPCRRADHEHRPRHSVPRDGDRRSPGGLGVRPCRLEVGRERDAVLGEQFRAAGEHGVRDDDGLRRTAAHDLRDDATPAEAGHLVELGHAGQWPGGHCGRGRDRPADRVVGRPSDRPGEPQCVRPADAAGGVHRVHPQRARVDGGGFGEHHRVHPRGPFRRRRRCCGERARAGGHQHGNSRGARLLHRSAEAEPEAERRHCGGDPGHRDGDCEPVRARARLRRGQPCGQPEHRHGRRHLRVDREVAEQQRGKRIAQGAEHRHGDEYVRGVPVLRRRRGNVDRPPAPAGHHTCEDERNPRPVREVQRRNGRQHDHRRRESGRDEEPPAGQPGRAGFPCHDRRHRRSGHRCRGHRPSPTVNSVVRTTPPCWKSKNSR